MANFKELLVWQKSVQFVTEIYVVTKDFPSEEMYGLTSQLRRASISIPSNIAEGNSRRSKADYIQFLKIARGSCAEVETQVHIAKNLNYINDGTFSNVILKLTEIAKMINGLINFLKNLKE